MVIYMAEIEDWIYCKVNIIESAELIGRIGTICCISCVGYVGVQRCRSILPYKMLSILFLDIRSILLKALLGGVGCVGILRRRSILPYDIRWILLQELPWIPFICARVFLLVFYCYSSLSLFFSNLTLHCWLLWTHCSPICLPLSSVCLFLWPSLTYLPLCPKPAQCSYPNGA